MQFLRRTIYARARRHHLAADARGRGDGRAGTADPGGGAARRGRLTIGSALDSWQRHVCDGVVVVGAWGCGPAQISESMLRHHREILSLLFVYNDGAPLDGATPDRLHSGCAAIRLAPRAGARISRTWLAQQMRNWSPATPDAVKRKAREIVRLHSRWWTPS
jgi:hypothetical protein